MSQNEPRASSIQPGMLFCDRYRIERRLDEGGMATIYSAIDEDSDQQVAIKVLFPHYSDNTVVKARFLDEGRIQAMLEHPNIVHVYEVIKEPVLCFVMEYVEGETLDDYLRREEPLSEREIVNLIMPVMSAVGFAHSKGIIHRDLKPSNVLLRTSAGYPEPKVMDFGVAKVNRSKELTADGTTVGTLHYMSPEQIVGSRNIDGRADIYSLGCSLFKLCTGEVPFNASSEFALMMAQVEAPPTPPSKLRPDLSPRLEEIILRALAKEPENRFQTIKEMTSALIDVGGEQPDEPDTITRPIPAHLLEFAMAADEVALDRTDSFRLEYLAQGADTLDLEPSGMTHELSPSAVRKIKNDRIEALRRKGKDLPELSDAETTERQQKSLDDTQTERLDDHTTLPDTGTSSNEDLPTTTERKRPDLATIPTEKEDLHDDVLETIPLSERRRAPDFSAAEAPGVDSQEVTNVRVPPGGPDDLRETREQPASDRSSVKEQSHGDSSDVTASTAVELPSLREKNRAVPPGNSHTADTSDQRPSAKLGRLRKQPGTGESTGEDDITASTAAERPALRTSSSTGTAREKMARTTVDENDEPMPSGGQRREPFGGQQGNQPAHHPGDRTAPTGATGMVWLGIGVSAVLLALLILGWVLFIR